MSNKIVILAIGILTGAVISVWYLRTNETQRTDAPLLDVGTASVETRLVALENAAEQIESIRGEIELLRSDLVSLSQARTDQVTSSSRPTNGATVGNPIAVGAGISEVDRLRRIVSSPGGAIGALVEAGFTRARAEQIERLIEENRVAAMQARYAAARRGESPPPGQP